VIWNDERGSVVSCRHPSDCCRRPPYRKARSGRTVDSEILLSIAESIRRIGAYVDRAGPAWVEDDMVLDAIAKRLEQIGELAKRLPPEILGRMANVGWKGVKGIREVLVHN